MTLEEAFAELGIDPGTGSDGTRRAYLRLLKTRKPETDPEGFMRLRAAYDLVKANESFFEAFRSREPAEAPQPEVPAVSEEPPAANIEVPATEIEVPAVSVETPPAVVKPPLRAWKPTTENLHAPVVERPDDAEPPVYFGDVALMESLLARSAFQKAATQALLILTSATNRLDRPDPPVLSCLRLMLGLHRVPDPAKAREVSAAFKAWLAATGRESTRIRGHAAVLWTLVRELDALKKGMPDEVRTSIARAALEGDLIEAKPELVSFRRRQRSAAQTAGELLRRKAPVIAAALADTLDPPEPVAAPRGRTPSHQGSSGSSRGLWFIPMLLIGVLRIFLAAGRSTPSYPSYSNPLPNYSNPLPSYEMPRPGYPSIDFDAGEINASPSDLERVQVLSRARRIMDSSPSNGRINLRAKALVAALEADNCSAALAAAADIHAEAAKIKKTIQPVLDADIVVFEAKLHHYCGYLSQGAEEAVEVESMKDAGQRGKTGK